MCGRCVTLQSDGACVGYCLVANLVDDHAHGRHDFSLPENVVHSDLDAVRSNAQSSIHRQHASVLVQPATTTHKRFASLREYIFFGLSSTLVLGFHDSHWSSLLLDTEENVSPVFEAGDHWE